MIENNINNIQEGGTKKLVFSLQKITTEKFLTSDNNEIVTENIKLETKLKFGLNENKQVFSNFS